MWVLVDLSEPDLDLMLNAGPGNRDQIASHLIAVLENITRIKKMGVKNLPATYINGELKFSSSIPSQRELTDIVKQHVNEATLPPPCRWFSRQQ